MELQVRHRFELEFFGMRQGEEPPRLFDDTRSLGAGWLKAPRIPDSFIINLSTAHLAVNLTGQDRYSTPFFYIAHVDYRLPACQRAAVRSIRRNIRRSPMANTGWWLNNNYRAKLAEA